MKWCERSGFLVLVLALVSFAASPVRAQEAATKYRLHGFYVRGGFTSFDKALILNWDERELMLSQSKKMTSFGAGYALLPSNSWAGLNVGAQYARTALDPFSMKKITDPNMSGFPTSTLVYKDFNYSLLMFDLDAYLVPSKHVPFAFTLGVMLGGSFQSYAVSGDNETVQNANGSKSMNMFRYGYKLGCKIMPFRFLSVDLEYRPMSAYSSTTELTEFLYTKDGWNYYGKSKSTEGPSEKLVSAGLSIHFH